MERKAWLVLGHLLCVLILVAHSGATPPSAVPTTPEELHWQEANSAYTVASFQRYLALHPAGPHAAEARANIAALQAAEKQTPRRVKGIVKTMDESSRTLTIATPMGKTEVLRITDATWVQEKGTKRQLPDLTRGSAIQIEYTNLPDGTLLAGKISMGYTRSHCSCGAGCRCPISKGCRAIIIPPDPTPVSDPTAVSVTTWGSLKAEMRIVPGEQRQDIMRKPVSPSADASLGRVPPIGRRICGPSDELVRSPGER